MRQRSFTTRERSPPMPKRRYSAVPVNTVDAKKIAQRGTNGLIFAIDIAKTTQFGAFVTYRNEVVRIVRWEHPTETRELERLLLEIRELEVSIQVVLESSGVYGDSIRYVLSSAGFEMFRVSPKRTHDAAEVFDGTPSMHDAKAATIIGRLHASGLSSPWSTVSEGERAHKAQLKLVDVHQEQWLKGRARLEGMTARHWPEVTHILDPKTASYLELLASFGSAQAVAATPEKARACLRRSSHQALADEKIDRVLESAATTVGMPPTAVEERVLRALAREARHHQVAMREAVKELVELTKAVPCVEAMTTMIGVRAAATVYAAVGAPEQYSGASSLLKSMGLNLRTFSSGKCRPGRLSISKRGNGAVRRMLWLAALRAIRRDPVVGAWFAKKVKRDGGKKGKAIVAVMRKMVRALWHVAQGAVYDSRLLFDTTRLKVAS